MSWTEVDRRELAELGREQDRMLFEHEQWMARRNAEREAPMRENERETVVYRAIDNNELAAARPSAPTASDDGLDPYTKQIVEFVVMFTDEKLAELRAEREAALVVRDRRIGALENELVELKGFLRGVLAVIGGDKAKSMRDMHLSHDDSAVIDLPAAWRTRDAA